ncbi:MAG: 16S rRNA (uracil(1498)-N(3))-methyltransferase [Bacteroidota bacterium]
MQLFYTTNINNQIAILEAEEARHLQVLRKKVGDQIHLVDGKGFFYLAELLELHKKEAQLRILSGEQQTPSSFSLHIAIAPTKNIARLEWFLEKATEIGIQEITPIYCEHSERKRIRLDRLEKIVLSAMKQSNRAYLPKLNEETTFKQFVRAQQDKQIFKYIAHCEEEEKVEFYDNYQARKDVLVLIGPEGDFSFSEIELAKNAGFLGVSLGKARLRTETAGIVACHTIQLLNQMK